MQSGRHYCQGLSDYSAMDEFSKIDDDLAMVIRAAVQRELTP